jgi:hypothetical protein
MELQARVTALEEELSIIKGEIKSILQEVRVAVLARQNPFNEDNFGTTPSPAGAGWPSSDEPFSNQPAPAPTAAPAIPATAPLHVIAAQPAPQAPAEPDPTSEQAMSVRSSGTLDLAGLLSWLQETAEQFNSSDFKMLVQLAAYGGLIDGGLEESLVELAETVSGSSTRKASLPEFALALQKLEAVRAMKSITQTNGRRYAA